MHTKANPEEVTKFSGKLNLKSALPSFDSTSLQGITSQSEGIKPLRICEEPKSSTAIIEEFENDEVDQIDDGKVNICDNDHDSALLSMVYHDEMNGIPSTAELNKGSVRLEREVELKGRCGCRRYGYS
ncbi:unnamed protein product [Trichobilharzia regenti]|nr:unnamed protein product [Trichobilharzia regenti]